MGLSVSGRTCLALDLQFLSASALRGADSMAACSDWHGE